ncbi:5-(carboxyamino)imidazole ribonucleotide mutase [Anaerococcus porci]|uniref:5-(carboxyamino)imidazole ribonucleotide mutase n=1 Tax=Anaerococcus porci TaxID=2652269 RepID=UPI002A7635CF|nr:5-(carboxyamino)imidazole ribonucleotide mutase [Anaerococcus porci]MDY3006676.1 5-(carboxyamino)imidazole ribonucleotide mutase [Anaerococcus porci]
MKVSVIIGSLSDSSIADKVVKKLKDFGIEVEVKVISAHRALKSLEKYVKESENESEVYIGIAGKAAHLSGVIAAITTRPVIGIPAKSSHLGGIEALLSTVEMPTGVPVATVAIGGGENAAILAAEILAVKYDDLREKLKDLRVEIKKTIDSTEYIYGNKY